jgi:hypothetical protein
MEATPFTLDALLAPDLSAAAAAALASAVEDVEEAEEAAAAEATKVGRCRLTL